MLNRYLVAVIAAIIIASALTAGALAEPRLLGDANGDGKLSTADVVAIIQSIVAADADAPAFADFNGDGTVNARDVVALMRYLVGWHEASDDLLEYTYGIAAPDFEVADPVTDRTVAGADFGFDTEAADNCDAFAAAAAYLAENPGTTLRLEKGTYRMGKNWVELSDIKNCVIDGGGSKFLYNDRNYFRLNRCEGLKLCNFSIDWDATAYHIASLVRIKSVTKDHVVEFEFYEETDASYALDIDDWGVMFNLDPEDLAPGVPGKGDWLASPQYIKTRELTAPNIITSFVPDLPLKVGEVYLLRHFQYGAEAFGIYDHSSHIVLEDVDIHTGPSSGFYIQDYSDHVRLTRVNVEPNPEEFDRFPISTTADALAIRDTCGYIIIEDCSVGYCYDDIMNIHDNVGYTVDVEGNTITIHAFNTSAFNVGDTLAFRNEVNFAPLDVTAKITGIRWLPDNERELTLDCDAESAGVEYGTIIHDKSTDTAHVIIRGCYFHQGRSRMLLAGSDTVFENNLVYKTQLEPILIGCGIGVGSWATCEGEGVDSLIIRNNVFDSCNVKGQRDGALIAFEASCDLSPGGKLSGECFTNVMIAHNRFVDPSGCMVNAISVKNLIIYGNESETTREPWSNVTRSAMSKIRVLGKYHDGTRILGNVWLASEYFLYDVCKPYVNAGKGTVEIDGNYIK